MKKILAFSGSNSSQSINSSLVKYTLSLVESETKYVNLIDFDFPLFSVDLENEIKQPKGVKDLLTIINLYDKIIISTPEHNGSIPAFFKNILDWLSRSGVKYLDGKDILLMSTSTGKGAAVKAAEYAEKLLKYAGGNIQANYSLPEFNKNFTLQDNKISDEELNAQLIKTIAQFLAS
ncbi:NADPH-dependent FMN reductase [Crocinitomix catalasitica]|uniref:NADPH-dependent FMN reductase n=1 Tax=Crocinitomix catalasitica TaxID=184607 RepID=UPI0004832594|nr:NADPH-dependent FMN reductase [Crocinitomix catalasitica]